MIYHWGKFTLSVDVFLFFFFHLQTLNVLHRYLKNGMSRQELRIHGEYL